LNWSWETGGWKKSTRLWLLAATIWPIIYMAVFSVVIISVVFAAERAANPCGQIDVLQLDKKIRDGEIKKLSISSREIVATDRKEGCTYEVFVTSATSHDEILRDAKELVDGKPRVETIDENASPTAVENPLVSILAPIGFFLLMIVHVGTIFLMMAQMPFYIVLAVKNTHLDQTMMIVWIILFALVSVLACPIYWYLYIWRKPKDALPGAPSAEFNAPASA
jgi:ATP-dependent Zn protease